MAKITLMQGDCLSSVAISHGFDPQLVWEHGNNADLRELRVDANALMPGDLLFIPDIEEKQSPVDTDTVKTFQLSVGPLRLRVRLTRHGQARSAAAYELEFDQGTTLTGETDGEGFVDQPMPLAAKTAILRIMSTMPSGPGGADADAEPEEFELVLGHLDPHLEPTGVQARLRGLGYYFGEVDGDLGLQSRAALKRFQTAQGLTVSGQADDATTTALRDAFGS